MKRRSTIAAWLTLSLVAFSGLACGGGDEDVCPQITGYMASTTTPLTFATDIYPILTETTMPSVSMPHGGCAQEGICHGNPPGGLDDPFAPTVYLQFLFDPADMTAARNSLSMASLNAPTMMRVVPGNVGQSFLAYKIWDKDRKGLACVNAKCVPGASAGNHMPCGDQMPSIGDINPGDRTKILDWIAQGAN